MKHCNKCGLDLEVEAFSRDKSKPGGRNAYCRQCVSRRMKAWYEANRERVRAKQAQSYPRTREGNRTRILAVYGLTPQEYDRMLADQSGGCAICGGQCQSGKRLAVDHCHETGVVRGLLCANCNRGLGLMRDDPDLLRKAADYLAGSLLRFSEA